MLVEKFKDLVKEETGKPFPQDVMEQLKLAINAVFDSWNTQRAKHTEESIKFLKTGVLL